MKKVINGKRYDTGTAQRVGIGSNDYAPNDHEYFEEHLYQKRTGEFFIHGFGNALSKYSRTEGYENYSGDERLIPLTEKEAKSWAERYLDADEYEKLFDLGTEDEDTTRQSIYMSVALNDKLREAAKLSGQSISQVVSDALEKFLD